jgi:molybdate transport system substrate-binding protein
VFSFDASSSLARQIKLGSPADVYISADQRWMDDVESAGAIRAGTRQDLLANDLVVVAPAGRAFDLVVSSDFDFTARLPQVRRIAVGDQSHVPAGRYARQALESLGWWDALAPLLVPALDVRAALRLVEIGEVDAGIVYATDAAVSDRVVIVAAIPAGLHEPVHYPVALCSDSAAAAEFAAFLRTADMAAVFQQAGFRVLAPPSPRPDDAAAAGDPR